VPGKRLYVKDPDAVLDYQFDWSRWLQPAETISAHTATVTGATRDSSAHSDTSVTVWVSGGTAGTTATVACRITTSANRVDERTVALQVRHR
jgi:hypothetical protein